MRLIGITPFEMPDPVLAAALCRAGVVGVLDLGRDRERAARAVAELQALVPHGFGVRLDHSSEEWAIPEAATWIVIPAAVDPRPMLAPGRRVVVQVCSVEEARFAQERGADALIVKGRESGGAVGAESAFILLQRVIPVAKVRVYCQGGIGFRTAAACVAMGAAGVVLDSQLALLRESQAPKALREALVGLDGSETEVVSGRRVLLRPAVGELAAGQDVAFAEPFGKRFDHVASMVSTLEGAIDASIRQAMHVAPLSRDAPLARSLGVRFPILQGPMTRVSDRPAFAAAIADGGALPFVALAVSRGPEVAVLLRETAARMAGRSWGVGVLGFAPAELMEEQLAAIAEVKPPVALLAGGQAYQVHELEGLGIATYVHVPSPTLLDLYLKEGCRRFVFEGNECGGHVGPRSSFVLWEQAIERLCQWESLENVHLVFAGGIHDARSAAAVSVLVAPLAARGANVGVLMGTAYLFTEEAVRTEAILEGYQRVAIECEGTKLLETGPGHATRVADTQYVRFFEAERERLSHELVDAKIVWSELERLNLGRLRLASKGLVRSDDRLGSVGHAVQLREGLFMLGEVASLRGARTTIATLHQEVSEGSAAVLAAAIGRAPPSKAGVADIAIVGMACVFPQAENLDRFWHNIVFGKDCVTEVPADRWNKEVYYDPAGGQAKSNSKWGGFVPDVPFEPEEYGIPPTSLASIHPAQLLALHVAKASLSDAGLGEENPYRRTTSVVFGAGAGGDLQAALYLRASYPGYVGELPGELDRVLPRYTEDTFPGMLANVIAGRVANRLDLGGLNCTVDAACASSLAAVDLACKELAQGSSDVVLAGGCDVSNAIADYINFTSVKALSPTGRCRAFDAQADGIVLGEGVAAVVLKRLEDATRDGDRVYAVIKGVGASSDGRALGLTAPRREGQERALARAYGRSGVSPAEVGLVEAHGTGTVLGDRTELEALTAAFFDGGALPDSCTLGSVKSLIGHTKCAAGLAGLIKAALSVYHGVLPPTGHLQSPNASFRPGASPFVFRDRAAPWTSAMRAAAVSAMGFGGTNFHVVLQNHGCAGGTPLREWPAELFVMKGEDLQDALATAARMLEVLEQRDLGLAELAAGCAVVRTGPVQVAVVAESVADLRAKLSNLCAGGKAAPGVFVRSHGGGGKVAFLFPGQGSQRPHMMSDTVLAFPRAREWLERGQRFASVMFPSMAFDDGMRSAQRSALRDTRVAQPTLGLASLAVAEALEDLGLVADMAGGHSYGELAALAYAGSIRKEDLLDVSSARAEAILAAIGTRTDPGAMVAVQASSETVLGATDTLDGVELVNYNGPEQTVIAGSSRAVERAAQRLREQGFGVRSLEVACAFHSRLLLGADQRFASALQGVEVRAPRCPVFSNTTASEHDPDPHRIRRAIAEQIVAPVRFEQQVRAMYAAGARIFVEVGPSNVLTGLVRSILHANPHVAVATDRPQSVGPAALLLALAEVAVAGAPMDVRRLFEGRKVQAFHLTDTPARGPSSICWVVNGHRARPLTGPAPAHGLVPVTQPIQTLLSGASAAGSREQVVLEFLRRSSEVVETQRQVMLRYFGGGTGREAAPDPDVSSMPSGVPVVPLERPEDCPRPDATERQDAGDLFLEMLAQRTGYPKEMLEPNLDLEADLGVDSIKRTEILGVLAERLGFQRATDRREGARARTIHEMMTWLRSRAGATSRSDGTVGERALQATASEAPEVVATDVVAPGVRRYVSELRPIPESAPRHISVRGRLVVISQHALSSVIGAELASRGAEVIIARSPAEVPSAPFGFVFLSSESADPAKAMFAYAKAMVGTRPKIIAGVSFEGDRAVHRRARSAGGGLAGLLKSLAQELQGARVKCIHAERFEGAGPACASLVDEVISDDDVSEVVHSLGHRLASTLVACSLQSARNGLAIGPRSVILITGGARGITAQIAVAMARQFGCRFELVGSSPWPEAAEDETTANLHDPAEVRRALALAGAAIGNSSLGDVERRCRRLFTDREMRRTVAAIDRAGGVARYTQVDVRDAAAFGAFIAQAQGEHGRVDGFIHAAGICDDRLLIDKSPESFDLVYDTKVNGARTLLDLLAPRVRFGVFFSSVAGVFGSRGQCDYAAANAFLDRAACEYANEGASRILSVSWGPWGGDIGMVTPELARSYGRRGIELLTPRHAVDAFMSELGSASRGHVVLTAGLPEGLTSDG